MLKECDIDLLALLRSLGFSVGLSDSGNITLSPKGSPPHLLDRLRAEKAAVLNTLRAEEIGGIQYQQSASFGRRSRIKAQVGVMFGHFGDEVDEQLCQVLGFVDDAEAGKAVSWSSVSALSVISDHLPLSGQELVSAVDSVFSGGQSSLSGQELVSAVEAVFSGGQSSLSGQELVSAVEAEKVDMSAFGLVAV